MPRSRAIRISCAFAAVLLLAGCGEETPAVTGVRSAPTATSKPTSVQPRLGGQLADFVARFGQPNDYSNTTYGQYHFARYPGSNIDQIIVAVDRSGGAAYQTTVFTLIIQASASWDMPTAQAQCAPYLPADATPTGQQVDVTTPQGIEGKDVLYRSTSLGTALPASEFVDTSQNRTMVGLFDVLYTYAKLNDPSAVVGCQMLPGTQQTTA
jgi:hypothetical protein